MDHEGEGGGPCTRHALASLDPLLGLAMVGSRASGFQHDVASKLQSLVMSLEEIGDRADALDDADLTIALTAAREAVRDMTAQLQVFRQLSRQPPAAAIPLREVFAFAAERAALRVRTEPPPLVIVASGAETVHAVALLLDGALGRATPRELEVAFTARGFAVPLGASNEAVTVATYVFKRSGGTLRCTADQIVVTWA